MSQNSSNFSQDQKGPSAAAEMASKIDHTLLKPDELEQVGRLLDQLGPAIISQAMPTTRHSLSVPAMRSRTSTAPCANPLQ